MPVLDAKALEIDPKGAAFLKSVCVLFLSLRHLPRKRPESSRSGSMP